MRVGKRKSVVALLVFTQPKGWISRACHCARVTGTVLHVINGVELIIRREVVVYPRSHKIARRSLVDVLSEARQPAQGIYWGAGARLREKKINELSGRGIEKPRWDHREPASGTNQHGVICQFRRCKQRKNVCGDRWLGSVAEVSEITVQEP